MLHKLTLVNAIWNCSHRSWERGTRILGEELVCMVISVAIYEVALECVESV